MGVRQRKIGGSQWIDVSGLLWLLGAWRERE